MSYEKSVPIRVLQACTAWVVAFALIGVAWVLNIHFLSHIGIAVAAMAAVLCVRRLLDKQTAELRSLIVFREDVEKRLTSVR